MISRRKHVEVTLPLEAVIRSTSKREHARLREQEEKNT